jgi:hypothetical protein
MERNAFLLTFQQLSILPELPLITISIANLRPQFMENYKTLKIPIDSEVEHTSFHLWQSLPSMLMTNPAPKPVIA